MLRNDREQNLTQRKERRGLYDGWNALHQIKGMQRC